MTDRKDLDTDHFEEALECDCEGECECELDDEIWEQERAESLKAIQHKADFAVSMLIAEAISMDGATDAWDDAWEAMSRSTLFGLSRRVGMISAEHAGPWRDSYRREMLQVFCSIIDEHAEAYGDEVTAKDYLEAALKSNAN